MNLGALIARGRAWLNDETVPFLWSDSFLTDAANQAQIEACMRRPLLTVTADPAISRIAVTAGLADYPLHPTVLLVQRVMIAGEGAPLILTAASVLDRTIPNWAVATGTPTVLLQDPSGGTIRLYPIPVASGELTLLVWRLPTQVMTAPTDTPEIPLPLHDGLVHWMVHQALLMGDSERQDQATANRHRMEFANIFGLPMTWRDYQEARIHPADARAHPLVGLGGGL